MRRLLFVLMLLLVISPCAQARTRALLCACHDFVTQPSLGSAVSGNLQLLASCFLSAGLGPQELFIEDGTIDSPDTLTLSAQRAFQDASEEDLSIFYLCTHGLEAGALGEPVFLLSDGSLETELTPQRLFSIMETLPGEKLLILDACHSGAFIDAANALYPRWPETLSVLASAQAGEAAWYYAHDGMPEGALSYFAGALCRGLGLYGPLQADLDGDGDVTLQELEQYLRLGVASSTCRLRSRSAKMLTLPTCEGLSSLPVFSFSSSAPLLTAENDLFRFSFTLDRDTRLQYRLTRYSGGAWAWDRSTLLYDGDPQMITAKGRKNRSLRVDLTETDAPYLIFQLFAFEGDTPILCAERLLALQDSALPVFDLQVPGQCAQGSEVPLCIEAQVPLRYSVTIHNEDGMEIRRLLSGDLTRPGQSTSVFWDTLDEDGRPAEPGLYEIRVSAQFGDTRTSLSRLTRLLP